MQLTITHLTQGVLISVAAMTVMGTASAQDFVRPEWVSFMMPAAVDHVVELVVDDPLGSGLTKAVIYRSGALEREDVTHKNGRAESRYADFATGFSWQISGSDVGTRSLNFSAGRLNSAYAITRTSQTDHLLGETCEVWSLQHKSVDQYAGWSEEDCLTTDGILLWQKLFYSSGGLMSSAHATSINRRPVKGFEVRVPAKALNLSTYGDWTAEKTGLNDEVLMEQGSTVSSLTRRLGVLSMTEELAHSPRYRTYMNSTYMISLVYNRDGSLIRLDVGPLSGHPMPKTPSQPAKMQTVEGETCEWFERMPWGADGGLSECMTSDGLVLARNSESRGGGSAEVAAAKSRGRLTYSDVAPPVDLLLGGWGRSNVSSPIIAKSQRTTPRRVTPKWSALPSLEVQMQNYPERARLDEVEGVVTLNCTLAITGRLKSCEVVSESPKGYGFGEAAVALFTTYARAEPGNYQTGDVAGTTFKWSLP